MNNYFLKLRRGSMPWNILCRFDLWRKMINNDKNSPAQIKIADCLNSIAKSGKLIAARMEAKEIILLAINVSSQTITVSNKINLNPGIFMDRPKRTPSVVATPFPPLKFKKTVQLWPQILLIPAISKITSEETANLPEKILPSSITGRNPFIISRISTVTPQPLPKRRKALVAPTLPEPNLRISTPLMIRPNKYAVGIEPTK